MAKNDKKSSTVKLGIYLYSAAKDYFKPQSCVAILISTDISIKNPIFIIICIRYYKNNLKSPSGTFYNIKKKILSIFILIKYDTFLCCHHIIV